MNPPEHFSRPRMFLRGLLVMVLLASVFLSACSLQPEAYSEGQMLTLAETDQRVIMEGVPPLSRDGKLGLEEAIMRALMFDLDQRLALSENIVAERERVLAAVSMLPDITATGNFYDRSNYSASSSMSYKSRQQSLEPSYSSNPDRQWGNLEFSWSILDCGLSYFRAKQQADRVLITLERRRRAMNTIVKDVIVTYYRAAAAQQYLGGITTLIGEAEKALQFYRRIEKEHAEPLPLVLEKQRSLINVIAGLKRIESNLKQSKVQLAALCNLPLHEACTLTSKPMPLPDMRQQIADLELLGLYRRPELREEHYQERIDVAGVKQEILKMFPAIRILGSFNLDANPYLVNAQWWEAGLNASVSLLKLAAVGPAGKKSAEARQELSQMRRLALSMATLVQINLSRNQYAIALEELHTADSLRDVEERLLKQVREEAAAGSEGRLALVLQEAQTVSSKLLHDLARVDAYGALGNLYFSVGVGMADTLPVNASIDEIGHAVRKGLTELASGTLPPLPAKEAVTDVDTPKVFNDNLTAEERLTALERNARNP